MGSERMIVVANSRKTGGRCIAGLSTRTGELVRPVSPGGGGELSDEECAVDEHIPRLLEVVTFTHQGSEGIPAQPENVVIDGEPWQTEGLAEERATEELLKGLLEKGPRLLGNNGRAVPAEDAAKGMSKSLALVEPAQLRFGHGPDAEAHRGSPRAVFRFGGRRWSLPVTDFEIGPRILKLPEGLYGFEGLDIEKPERVILTVSLGTEYEGWHHKLVAGIIRLG